MHGFSWVRIDRTADRTAPLKKLARGCGKDEVWGLGLLVRTKLTYATRFPAGVADLTAEDLALELDVDEVAVAQMVAQGFLQQLDDGLAFVGWQDDPAVRDLVSRRQRATGSRTADDRQATGSLPAAYRQEDGKDPADMGQPTGSLPTGDRQPAVPTVQNSTVQNGTVQNRTVAGMTPLPPKGEMGQGKPDLLPVAYGEGAAIVLDAWPPEKRCNPRAVVMAIRQDGMQPDAHTCTRIADAARAWVAAYSQQGRAQYLPRLDNWISAGSWREAPPDAPAPAQRRARTKNGEVALTHDDMSAIIAEMKAAEASHNTKGQDEEDAAYPF